MSADISPYKENELDPVPKELKESNMQEALFWYKLAHSPTPKEVISKRPHDGLEYVKEYYVLDEMNKLFPGWWQEDMKTEYIQSTMTFITTGYFCFQYPTAMGMKVRKIYSIGALLVQGKKENKAIPSQPDDMAKGSLTEWFRIAGKRLGIARDIYSQEVTNDLVEDFHARIKGYEKYTIELESVANTITKGSAYRDFLSVLPNQEQINKIGTLIKLVPEEEKKSTILKMFWKMNNSNPEETKKINNLIKQLEEKLCQKN